MEPWMGVAIFGGAVGLIAIGIMVAFKRMKALEQAAAALGLKYVAVDQELAKTVQDKLPLFRLGQVFCGFVMSAQESDMEYYIFQYSYLTKTYGGRANRESRGVVVCFHLNQGSYSNVRELSHPEWKMECEGEWMVLYLSQKSEKYRLSAENLPQIKSTVLDLYRGLTK